MKVTTYVLVALGISFVAPLSINAQKPKAADHSERRFVEVKECNQEKSGTKTPSTESKCPAPWLIREISKVYGTHYLVSFYTTLAHEYGHKIAAKLLYGVDSTVGLTPTWVGVDGYTKYHSPIPATGLKSALVFLAGPVCGLACGYTILKAYNVLSEYYDQGKNVKNALKDGIKKSVLNADQCIELRSGVVLDAYMELINIMPFTTADGSKSDGAYLVHALKNL